MRPKYTRPFAEYLEFVKRLPGGEVVKVIKGKYKGFIGVVTKVTPYYVYVFHPLHGTIRVKKTNVVSLDKVESLEWYW